MTSQEIGEDREAPKRRVLLAIVLALIASVLIAGGAYLLLIGGSAYYFLAGLAVALSSYYSFVGSDRAIQIYLAMLLATLAWSLWESTNIWGVQARVLAPLLLGTWVAWPWVRRLPMIAIVVGGVVPLSMAALAVYFTVRDYGSLPTGLSSFSKPALVDSNQGEWRHFGNDLGGTRYSSLKQINVGNIDKLERAWTYHTGDNFQGHGLQATPLMIGDTVYLCSPTNQVHALDAETGERRWLYDPQIDPPITGTCRGVAYFKRQEANGECPTRIITATIDARLIALDAMTGELCKGFGTNGFVDLTEGMGEVLKDYYYVSSAPTLIDGKVIVGGNVMDGQMTDEPSGVIRAFDAVTGEFVWAWDMDRPEQHGMPPDGESFSRGTANSWAPMSGDEKLGLVFVPTGNATPDYWGAHRSQGSEKYGSSVVAIDVETGEARWHFQTVHHDVWDYDIASQPTLVDFPLGGKVIPALVQPTKRGEIFVLDRETGTPLVKTVEMAVPEGVTKGERLSKTQPFAVGMPGFGREILDESMMWGATPIDQLWCRIRFRQARYDGAFTPPGFRSTITYPGFVGGMNWGSVSIDPENGVLVTNYLRMPNYTRLITRKESNARGIFPTTSGAVPHVGAVNPQSGTPYAAITTPFLSPLAMPCLEPPYGKIAAINLHERKVVWEKPLGTSYDAGPLGLASRIPLPMGVPTHGGSLITKGGVVFIGASQERRFRAFDLRTGKQLWSRRLPAGGNANPMTYVSPKSGRQFVVIAAGGTVVLDSGFSDQVVAYAMPAN